MPPRFRGIRVYDLALFSYLFAFGHFGSEIFFFGTANLLGPVLSTVVVSSKLALPLVSTYTLLLGCLCGPDHPVAFSLAWMLTQYDFYVRA